MIPKLGRTRLHLIGPLSVFLAMIAAVPGAWASTNLLDGYLGASYGHADLDARDTDLLSPAAATGLGRFDSRQSAYQITAGLRGLEFLGAEVDYFDLGSGGASPSVSSSFYALTRANLAQKGEAAFAVLYLPVPIIDVYVKAGVARLTTDLSASVVELPCPSGQPCPQYIIGPGGGAAPTVAGFLKTTTTGFAAGAGVQWTFDGWTIRGEYERFSALGEHPSLLSAGLMRSFW